MRVISSFGLIVAMLLVVACVSGSVRTAAKSNRKAVGLDQIELTQWNLFSTAAPATVYSVIVPNTIVGGLLEAGYIPFDPMYGENLARIDKAQFAVPWVYNTTFSVSSTIGRRFVLNFEGVTYNATLTVNGKLVATQNTMVGSFQRYRFDITSLLSVGTNGISVTIFRAPHDPNEVRGKTGLELSFYDWTAHPPDLSTGLWRPAFISVLNASQPVIFDGFSVKTVLSNELGNNKAYVNVSFVVQNWSPSPITLPLVFASLGGATIQPPIVVTSPPVVIPGYGERRVTFSWRDFASLIINDPPLWYPWQMGPQTLLSLTAGVGSTAHAWTTVGLRSMETRLTRSGALQYVVNNVPIQLRGGAWCPDLFLRNDLYRLDNAMQLVRDLGFNAIRLEGKVEDYAFYDNADTLGLLIIADLGCCEQFPTWSSFEFAAAGAAMRAQVRHHESHPSMAAMFASSDLLPPIDIESMFNSIFASEEWPAAVVSSASQMSSPLTGQTGEKFYGPYSWVPPVYWLQDSSSERGLFGGAWGFATELGPGEAPMTYNSWQRTVPAQDLWGPQGAMGAAWNAHMGNPNGAFPSLQYFVPPLNARYGNSTNAWSFLYRSQAANYESMRALFEGYARNKHRNATGVIAWMMNNAQPQHLWHVFDYYLIAGGGYYGTKKGLSALVSTLSLVDGSVVLINSRFADVVQTVEVVAEIWSLAGAKVWSAAQTLPAVPADAALTLDFAVPFNLSAFGPRDTFFVVLQTTIGGNVSTQNNNWYWLSGTMDVLDFAASNGFRTPCSQWADFTALQTLANPNLSVDAIVDVATQHVTVTVTNPSTVVAFFIELHIVNSTSGIDYAPQIWSDNYVTLRPGESVTLVADLSLYNPRKVITPQNSILYYDSYNTRVGAEFMHGTVPAQPQVPLRERRV